MSLVGYELWLWLFLDISNSIFWIDVNWFSIQNPIVIEIVCVKVTIGVCGPILFSFLLTSDCHWALYIFSLQFCAYCICILLRCYINEVEDPMQTKHIFVLLSCIRINSSHAGEFCMLFCHQWIFYLKLTFSKNIFQEYHQSVKQFGSRSGLTFCRVWSGSILFAKVISRWQKSPLAGKELWARFGQGKEV